MSTVVIIVLGLIGLSVLVAGLIILAGCRLASQTDEVLLEHADRRRDEPQPADEEAVPELAHHEH